MSQVNIRKDDNNNNNYRLEIQPFDEDFVINSYKVSLKELYFLYSQLRTIFDNIQIQKE